jgi:CRISPR-associated exonuclease Cas4
MFAEEDLLPLSGLAQIVFCERRAALIHIEGQWQDNVATVEGSHLHRQVDLPGVEVRGDARIARGVLIRSLRLGLSGKADVIEFHRVEGASGAEPEVHRGDRLQAAVILPGVEGMWRPFPIEYKRGRLRREDGYEIQTCAQALCLEEMLRVAVPEGAIYYGTTRRRLAVKFTETLRRDTERAAVRLHELVHSGLTPRATRQPK